jgi:hypothetical protein
MTALETVVPAVQRHEKGRISVVPRAQVAVRERAEKPLCTGCRPTRSAATRRPRDGCLGLPDEDVAAALRRRCTSSDGRIVKDGRPLAESLGPLSGPRHPGPDPGSRGSNVRAILVAAHSAPQGIRPPGPPRRPSGSVGRRA